MIKHQMAKNNLYQFCIFSMILKRLSSSEGSVTFIFMIQNFAFSIFIDDSRVVTIVFADLAELNSRTSPATGRNRSEAVLTASTVPKTSPSPSVSPTVSTST
ncbi:unnamed protein product [Bathycoccus prasinos]